MSKLRETKRRRNYNANVPPLEEIRTVSKTRSTFDLRTGVVSTVPILEKKKKKDRLTIFLRKCNDKMSLLGEGENGNQRLRVVILESSNGPRFYDP